MATAITRWDPANDFAAMRGMMDRFFNQGTSRFPTAFRGGEDLGVTSLGLDVFETNDSFVVKAAIPGVDPEKVDIAVDDDVLTIKGEFEQNDEVSEGNYVRRELRYGSFQRSLRLPPTVDADKAQAAFENGVLKLTLPKKAEARARSFKITPQGVIDGQTKEDTGAQAQN